MADYHSKFEPFTLALGNSATLSGIVYIPPPPSTSSGFRPLLVLMHGGGCHAGHYDVDEAHSSSLAADALSLPVVSIDRPCYRGTSSLLPVPPGSTFHEETGRWEHEYILPALWETYGLPNGCASLVLMSHSLATPGLLVAASLHAQSIRPAYPLAGLIISGWGSRPNLEQQKARMSWTREQRFEQRGLLMLSDPALCAADERMSTCFPAQTVEAPIDEAREGVDGTWAALFAPVAKAIRVPIMFGLGEHDWLWQGTPEHVAEFASFFPKCPRFDGSVVQGAPHAIEYSWYAQGWYARCFGFAFEVSTFYRIKAEKD